MEIHGLQMEFLKGYSNKDDGIFEAEYHSDGIKPSLWRELLGAIVVSWVAEVFHSFPSKSGVHFPVLEGFFLPWKGSS